MQILFEDNHVIALFKPAGVLTQPSPSETESLEEEAKAFIKKRDKKPGGVFLHAIHRIDRPVSGIVLFAKTSKALSRLQKAIRERREKKLYLAEVEGHLKAKEGTFIDQLLHGNAIALIAPEDPEAKRSELRYRVVETRKSSSIVEIELLTGRYHQIRVQFASRGHPIVGDEKYGSKTASKEIALSHVRFEIPHPVSGEMLVIDTRKEL